MRIPVDERRAALAVAALRVIARDGVHAATTRAIAAEAGMPLASLHYAYRSRDELLREAVALVVAGEREAVAGLLDADGDEGAPPDIAPLVRAALGAYLDLLRAEPGREQGMLELTFHALRAPGLDGVAQEQYAQYRGLVAELFAAAAERCGIRWDTPVDALARMAVAATDGLTVAWLVEGDEAGLDVQLDLVASAIVAHAVPEEEP